MSKSDRRTIQQVAAVSRRADRQQRHAQLMYDHWLAAQERARLRALLVAARENGDDTRECDAMRKICAQWDREMFQGTAR